MNTDNPSTPADPQQEIEALKESYRLLKEENEKNAIAFAEWVSDNNFSHRGGAWIHLGLRKFEFPARSSSAELYQLYLKLTHPPSK